MPEQIFYSERLDERVAQYIAQHGGRVQTERVQPAHVFHKVTVAYTSCVSIGGDTAPIYRYTLVDGGILLVQFLRSYGYVPDHPDHYWTAIYIRKEGRNGEEKRQAETR